MSPVFFLVVGILFSLIGVLMILSVLFSYRNCNTKIEATVGRIQISKHFWRGKTIQDCVPIFSYSYDGKTYTEKADTSTRNPKKYTVGQKVEIYINAKKPAAFRSGKHIGTILVGTVLFALGCVLIICYFL